MLPHKGLLLPVGFQHLGDVVDVVAWRVRIEIVKIDCGHPFEISHPDGFDYYTIKLPLEGQCEYNCDGTNFAASVDQAFANNPGEPSKKRYNGS